MKLTQKNLNEQSEGRLKHLLDEMIVSSHTPSSPPSNDGPERRLQLSKFPLFPLFLSLVLLGGILLGTVFGYYWAKSKLAPSHIPASNTYEIIEPLPPVDRETQMSASRLAHHS